MDTVRFLRCIVLSLLLALLALAPPSLAQEEATAEPTAPPTEIPTEVPMELATEVPTEVATEPPTAIPTEPATAIPTEPSVEVTEAVTEPPTAVPALVEVTVEPSPPVEVTAEATLETLFAPAPLVARVEPVTEASLMVARVFVVNRAGDDNDLNAPGPYNGSCDVDSITAGNQCTLRAAIQEANFTADKDTINFNIPGNGPHIITPGSALPPITEPVIINGASEPLYTWGTPRIVLNGGIAGPGDAGLWLAPGSAGSTIKGLVINGGWQWGIAVHSFDNLIQANFLGTNPTGTAGDANQYGVSTWSGGATNNTIGGTAAALRNLISGNVVGVLLDTNSSGTRMLGNYIGTNKTGTLAVANGDGVIVDSSNGNVIGGTTAAARNLISGNGGDGIFIAGTSGNTLVMGNNIGTNAAGTGALPNGSHGVDIWSSNNLVGGAYPQAANRIANNVGDGIYVNSGAGNRLLTNWIYNNGGLGIDLFDPSDVPPGVTANDVGAFDADSGANNLQNYPILQRATGTRYVGWLDSAAFNYFRLQFFASPTCDPTPFFGEGQRYLGTAVVVTDAALGIANFDLLLPVAAPTGWAVTATATSVDNNTSEFSNCVKAMGAPLLLGPANNGITSDTTLPFTWKAVPGAESYLVEVSRIPTFPIADRQFIYLVAPATSTSFLRCNRARAITGA